MKLFAIVQPAHLQSVPKRLKDHGISSHISLNENREKPELQGHEIDERLEIDRELSIQEAYDLAEYIPR